MLSVEQVQSQASPYLNPISGSEPAGIHPNQDPRYEALRNTMASLDSPSGGQVDWVQVAKSGRELLSTATKDLLIASYTTYALFRVERLPGLAVGLTVIDGLLDRYWESMFPPASRLRGRGNALDWLVSRLEPELGQVAVSDRSDVDVVAELWKRVSGNARDKLGEHCPATQGIATALQRLQLRFPAAAAGAAPNGASTSADGAAKANGIAASTSPAATHDAPSPHPTSAASNEAPSSSPTTANGASSPASAISNDAPAPSPAPPSASPLEALRAQAEPWLAPIRPDAPTGVDDPRYDASYEAARTEVAKLDSPTAGPPDWAAVRKHADSVLKSKGKDVLIAAYLAHATFIESGFSRLPVGLVVVAELLERFGEDVHPRRGRARGNAIAWLVAQVDAGLAGLKLQASDRPTVLALEAAAKHLSLTVRDRLGENAPGMSPLTDRVKRLLLAIPEDKPKPPPPPPPTPAPASAPAPTPVPPPAAAGPRPAAASAVSSPEEVEKFLQDTGRGLVTAAGLLRRADPANATAYRLVRQGLWLHVTAAPKGDASGKTQIPAMPEPRRKQLETLAANAKWAALLEEAESAVSMFRFYLDLQRYTWVALDGQGAAFAEAKNAVVGEVFALLRRVPTIAELRAIDGSPLAGADTKTWLDTHVLGGAGPGAGSGQNGETSADDVGEAMAEVKKLMQGNKAAEALRLAQDAIDGAGPPRLRMLRRIALAEALLETGQPLLARGLFAALDRELRERGLHEWERTLARRCLEGLVKSIRATAKTGTRYEGADEAFERLCLVDPAAASRWAGP